jgi:HrpA-like RNA helicase
MSRSATLPPIRVTPETKASLEAVLREGESLTQFIENAVSQDAAVARAKKALRLADKGVGLMTAEQFLVGMRERAQGAQQRIRAAVAAKNKRSRG